MAMSPGGLLDVSTDWLKVAEWSTTQIIATDDSSICLTSQTTFDLKRKTVIALDVRKPEAQGLGGACNLTPDRQTYYLQDKVDYFGQKSFGTTK
jgi:tRNA G46 methylase TrmB